MYRVSYVASKAVELLPTELHEKLVTSDTCMSVLFGCIHWDHLENQFGLGFSLILVLQLVLL